MTIENQKILKAENKMYLTNGETYAKIVYLGKNDKIENWKEITENEYKKEIEKEQNVENEML